MEKLTPRKVFDNLVKVYREISTLEQDVKGIVEEAKDVLPEDTDIAGIKKFAKLVAYSKDGITIEKMKGFLALTEELEG